MEKLGIILIVLAVAVGASFMVYALGGGEKPTDFTLSVSPTSGTIQKGASGQATVSISAAGGYSETVSLSASGQPTGVTVSFSPDSGRPNFKSIMTISVGSTVAAGSYAVTIIGASADNKTHTCTYSLTVSGLPNNPPTADFVYSPSSPTTADTVQFTDASTDSDGTITAWSWTFGDGATSTERNPTHRYTAPGTYNATLTVTDDGGAMDSKSESIAITNIPPTANFTYSPSLLIIDDVVQFADQSTDPDGAVVSWSWDFGDGSTSTQQNPTHQYTSAGTYNATLTVTDDGGATDDISKTIEVLAPSLVEIINYQLFVNDSPFTIKGVCYSPTPVGEDVSGGYNWWAHSQTYTQDLPMLEEMGANTIRTYDATGATREAMDAFYQNGTYVIMGYWVSSGDFSDPSTRQGYVDGFVSMVHAWKDHPAVLMWAFGNEVSGQDFYVLLQEAAQAAHAEEGANYHPVICVTNRTDDIGNASVHADDVSLTALDAWGLNSYRGLSFGTLFTGYRGKTAKPFIMTEWGCDALDMRTVVEDQAMQATYVSSQWSDIEIEINPSGRCLGGTVFEWCDEWWKVDTPSTHTNTATWPNSAYYDYVGTNNMNEEWWGITAISPSTYEKTPREAYYTLKALWTTAA